jgi:hypothetical protein
MLPRKPTLNKQTAYLNQKTRKKLRTKMRKRLERISRFYSKKSRTILSKFRERTVVLLSF